MNRALQTDDLRSETEPLDERWEKLMCDWPEMFYYRFRGHRSRPIKAWGIQCGIGWHYLLARLLADLETEARRLGVPLPRISQIKEKCGDLRVHIERQGGGSVPPEFHSLIDRYSSESRTICEICGAPGQLFKEGYWVTRCEEHRDPATLSAQTLST